MVGSFEDLWGCYRANKYDFMFLVWPGLVSVSSIHLQDYKIEGDIRETLMWRYCPKGVDPSLQKARVNGDPK